MEGIIKNIVEKTFDHISDIGKCKENLKDFYTSFLLSNKNDLEQVTLMCHKITKVIRLVYQENLIKLLDNFKNNEYIEYGVNTSNLIIWMSDQEIIDYSSYLVLVEDILETFPLKDLEIIFDIFENNINTKPYSSFSDNRKLTMLKISNTILKRLSSSMNTKFRGRVQMALASIFPISDKSGVNQKGLYNMTNAGGGLQFTNEANHNDYSNGHNNKINNNNIIHISRLTNFRFYKQFWIVFKYMTNPFLLFSSVHSIEESEQMELLDEYLDITEIICVETDLKLPKLEIFLNNISKILSYFENHYIDLTDNSDTVLSYPKYLTSTDLFELQLKDSSFRLTIFTQFCIVLKSFLRPVSQAQKKAFVLIENEKNKINEILKNIQKLLKDSSYLEKITKILSEEECWENWKEAGCFNYEKSPSEDLKKEIEEIKNNITIRISKSGSEKYKNIKTKALFKVESYGNYDFNKAFDVNMNELKNIKSNTTYVETLKSENPFVGNFIERVFRDNDPQMEIEESIIKQDETFGWKFLRLVSFYDISRLNNESKIETIIKEYSDKYGKSEIKFSTKDFNHNSNNTTTSVINNNLNASSLILTESYLGKKSIIYIVEDGKDNYKESQREKEKQFIKKKRSIDRSDRSETRSYPYKKRKLD